MQRWQKALGGIAVVLAVPALAHAVTFGGVEAMNPAEWIADEGESPGAQLGVDAQSAAYHVSTLHQVVDAEEGITDRQAVVYERCGTPVAWKRTAVLGARDADARSTGLAVAPGGAAAAVWIDGGLGTSGTIRGSFKPADGTWGPVEDVATEVVGSVDVAIADDGDVTLLWQRVTPAPEMLRVAQRDAATATWSETATLAKTYGDQELAVAPDGTALVVHSASATKLESWVKAPGAPWGAETVATFEQATQVRDLEAEFLSDGRAVAAYHEWRDAGSHLRARTRGVAGAWSLPHTFGTFDGFGNFSDLALARHPGGAVLGWIQDEHSLSGNSDAGVARFSGTWHSKTLYESDDHNYGGPLTVAAASDGSVLFALMRVTPGPDSRTEVVGAQVPDLMAPWPAALERLSPAASASYHLREPHAAGGGRMVLAWEVHDGSDVRSAQAIASGGAAPACSDAPKPDPPKPDPPNPDSPKPDPPDPGRGSTPPPQHPPSPPAQPGGTPGPSPSPSPQPALPALRDVLRLPSTARCVRGRRLRVTLRGPVRSVRLSTGRRRSTRRGNAVMLKAPARGRFTVSVAITLPDGRTLTTTRRYRACR